MLFACCLKLDVDLYVIHSPFLSLGLWYSTVWLEHTQERLRMIEHMVADHHGPLLLSEIVWQNLFAACLAGPIPTPHRDRTGRSKERGGATGGSQARH